MAVEDAVWAMPLAGPFTEGRCIRLVWPEEHEFDAITALRNRPSVRRQFFDQRLLDPERNRVWLRSGMKRPLEALFSIRLKPDDAFAGAIGWSHGDPVAGSIELGRVMVDSRALRRWRRRFPPDYPGVAVDAGIAIRDFCFGVLGLRLIRMSVVESNTLSVRAALAAESRIVGTRAESGPDGSVRRVVDLEMNYDRWAETMKRARRPAPAARADPAPQAAMP